MGMDDNSNDRVKSKKISNADVRNASALRIRLNRMDSYVGSISIPSTDVTPMSTMEKRKQKMRQIFCCSKIISKHTDDIEAGIRSDNKEYFRVNYGSSKKKTSFLIRYLNWGFETSFLFYFVSAIIIYIIMIFLFAFLLMAAAQGHDPCIDQYPVDSGFLEAFAAVYTLSWTTFSTVGYGEIYPEINAECALLNFIASIESLIGVLYAGFCGAILFGKVQHIYSHATATFSDVCVVRYGEGCDEGLAEDDGYDDDIGFSESSSNGILVESNDKNAKKNNGRNLSITRAKNVPHPVLLFRVLNDRANQKNGSITNLLINIVGVIELENYNACPRAGRKTAPRRFFRKMNIEPSSVPLFDRIVYVRHILDEHSPLLNHGTRKMIKKLNGKWPPSIDTAEQIRSCLDFEQIVVSLEGTSAITKSNVSAQKIYQNNEVKIGWRFVDMTYQNITKTGKPGYLVDADLVNVIVEQSDGEGENLDQEVNLIAAENNV